MGILSFEIIVFFANVLLLFFYIKASQRFHWFDKPDEERKIHQHAIPTSAGLIFMSPLVLAFLLMPALFPSHSFTIGLILLVLMIMGGLDDFFNISVKIRLIIVSCACAYFLYSLYSPHDINYLLLFIYFLGMVWWINLYNFMDGADGMASLHAFIVICGYLISFVIFNNTHLMVLIYLILFLLCILSFILFNFPQAKIFMGDSGSFSVSFLIAAIALFGISENIFDQILVISFHLTFIVDATLTLLARIKFKHKLSQAHNLHLFQALIKDGKSHATVSLWYAMGTLLTVATAIYLAYIEAEVTKRLAVLLIEAGILSIIWFFYHSKTKFKRFVS